MRERTELDGKWKFKLDPDNIGISGHIYERELKDAQEIRIPHTFNVGNGTDDYRGAAWYEYTFTIPGNWKEKNIRICFEGVYRDADIWLNGISAGQHYGAGFTAFELNISELVIAGADNRITLRVDNSYSPYALPWFDQFDWADDGGIFRPVRVEASEKTSVENVLIDSIPQIEENTGRKDEGPADIMCRVSMTDDADPAAELRYEILDEHGMVAEGKFCSGQVISVPDVRYWHFDAPWLYHFHILVSVNGRDTDRYETRIGFRKFTVQGNEFILNGEKVHLVGTEWMPGSDPRIGNAEKEEDIARFLKLLKDCNCVYTRVHWQQSDYFYRWCDEHGIMVQEEIPLWGQPKEPVENTLDMVKTQCRETMYSHYNHPSIVSWGVGNELNGQSEVTRKYVADAVEYFKTIERNRPISFVSNTAWQSVNDACAESDIMMCNDYIGTWQIGYDNEKSVREFAEAHKDKPMLISEFGLCEPAFAGGDRTRTDIFLNKVAIYRKSNVAGFIYFCLNDYRTQMGEDGAGRLRQRIHGSTDCYGIPKPSYSAVQKECAPIEIKKICRGNNTITISLKARNDLPSYAVKGYYAEVAASDQIPVIVKIPDLKPGEQIKVEIPEMNKSGVNVAICRPAGETVISQMSV
ncbi:MAG: hypothetical protein LKF52_13210 [Butyrivibrio sp.]|nr:hypothetical protein [Butyrivibrio sp.]